MTVVELPPRRPVPAMTARSLTLLLIDAHARMDALGYPRVPAPTAPTQLALEA